MWEERTPALSVRSCALDAIGVSILPLDRSGVHSSNAVGFSWLDKAPHRVLGCRDSGVTMRELTGCVRFRRERGKVSRFECEVSVFHGLMCLNV